MHSSTQVSIWTANKLNRILWSIDVTRRPGTGGVSAALPCNTDQKIRAQSSGLNPTALIPGKGHSRSAQGSPMTSIHSPRDSSLYPCDIPHSSIHCRCSLHNPSFTERHTAANHTKSIPDGLLRAGLLLLVTAATQLPAFPISYMCHNGFGSAQYTTPEAASISVNFNNYRFHYSHMLVALSTDIYRSLCNIMSLCPRCKYKRTLPMRFIFLIFINSVSGTEVETMLSRRLRLRLRHVILL